MGDRKNGSHEHRAVDRLNREKPDFERIDDACIQPISVELARDRVLFLTAAQQRSEEGAELNQPGTEKHFLRQFKEERVTFECLRSCGNPGLHSLVYDLLAREFGRSVDQFVWIRRGRERSFLLRRLLATTPAK